jgi:hypothetical protein
VRYGFRRIYTHNRIGAWANTGILAREKEKLTCSCKEASSLCLHGDIQHKGDRLRATERWALLKHRGGTFGFGVNKWGAQDACFGQHVTT